MPSVQKVSLFSFPDPVNEVAARLVAGGVVLLSAAAIALNQPWLTALIAYGFIARVASGPTLSPGAIPPEVCERCANIAAELHGPA